MCVVEPGRQNPVECEYHGVWKIWSWRCATTALAKPSFPIAARHDIRTSRLALPMEMLRPVRPNIAISLSLASTTAISSIGTAKSFAISGNPTLLAISPSTSASRVIV
jgi:hypothetical protein